MLGSIPAGSLIKEKKKDRTFQQSILLHLLNKKKTHLGTS